MASDRPVQKCWTSTAALAALAVEREIGPACVWSRDIGVRVMTPKNGQKKRCKACGSCLLFMGYGCIIRVCYNRYSIYIEL